MAEKKVIGIDFTNREIRMVQVSAGRGLPRVERFAIGPIPDGVFQGGRLMEPGRLSEAVKDLLRGYRFSVKRAILGISGRYGVTRLVTLPKMTAAQTRDAINLQLNQYVPFPPGDSLYDFKTLREVKEGEQPSQEILLVATRRSSIQPLMKVMKNAGLNLIGVKITTLASFQLFEDLYTDSEQAIAFVDIRDSVTDISFVADNYFRLSRSIEFGLTNLTERIRTKLGVSHQEAVEYLLQNKVDLMESYRPAGMDTAEEGVVQPPSGLEGPKDAAELDRQLGLVKGDDAVEKVIRDAVLRSMGQFVNELMRSIRYFESQAKRRSRVGRIVMFGYIGGLEGLSEYLAEQTGLDVTVVTGLPGVESALDAADEQELRDREAVLVVPIGLAVEAVKKAKIDLNLIPREAVFRRKSFNAMKFAVVVAVILAAILANLYIQRNNEYNRFKADEAVLDQKIQSIKKYHDQSLEFKQHIATLEGKLKGVLTLAAAQPPWPVIMDELGRIMRDAAFIDEMHWDANGGTWEVHGFCIGTDEFQKLVVNFWHSDVLQMKEAGDIEPTNLDLEEGKLGPQFGDRGVGGGFGFSDRQPSMPGGEDSGAGAPVSGRSWLLPPAAEPTGAGIPVPEPRYKLPEGGGSAWQDIEWYFQGHEYMPPIYYEFKFSGTINPAVMQKGKDLFPELSDLVSAAPAGPKGPSGGTNLPPSTGPTPGAGSGGGDGGDDTGGDEGS